MLLLRRAWEVLHTWFTCFLAHELTQRFGRSARNARRMPRGLQSSGGGGVMWGRVELALWELHIPRPLAGSLGWNWTGLPAAAPTALPESLLSPQGETQPASFSDPQEPWLSLSPPPWPAPDLAQLQGRAPSSP